MTEISSYSDEHKREIAIASFNETWNYLERLNDL